MGLEEASRFEYSVPLNGRTGAVAYVFLGWTGISDWVACIAWDPCRRGGLAGREGDFAGTAIGCVKERSEGVDSLALHGFKRLQEVLFPSV